MEGLKMTLKEIKDNPSLIKDTESGAILSRPGSDKVSIQIRNLYKRIENLENQLEWWKLATTKALNKIADILGKNINDKSE